jgi:hypothetical protein
MLARAPAVPVYKVKLSKATYLRVASDLVDYVMV